MSAGKPSFVTNSLQPPRSFSGPRWLGALVPRISQPAFRRKSPAAASLMADWANVVGPALAAVTRPLRLTRAGRAADGSALPGKLTVRCAGPVALELQHLAPELVARINASAGFPLVSGLKFERGSPPPPPPSCIPVPAADCNQAGLEAISDPDLRSALAELRGRVRARNR
jgi:hypothetical protein